MKNLRWLLNSTNPDSMDSLGGRKPIGVNALYENGKFFRRIKKHKSSKRRNFLSEEQIRDIVERFRGQGHPNPDKLFNDIQFKWSAYVLQIAGDQPERLVSKRRHDGSRFLGFYHINPDGSRGGFVSAYCHFHSQGKSIIIDEKSMILGEVLLVNSVEMRNSTIFKGGMLNSSYLENCVLTCCEASQSRLIRVKAESSCFIESAMSDSFFLDASALKKTVEGMLVHGKEEYPVSGLREHPLFSHKFANQPANLPPPAAGNIAFCHLKKEKEENGRHSPAI